MADEKKAPEEKAPPAEEIKQDLPIPGEVELALQPETYEKLGLNPDGSEIEGWTPPENRDETGDDKDKKDKSTDKDDKDKSEKTNVSSKDQDKNKSKKPPENKDDETGDNEDSKEQPPGDLEDDPEAQEKATKFLESIAEPLSAFIEDEELRDQLAENIAKVVKLDKEDVITYLSDFENREKFTASNTKKSQELSDREKLLPHLEALNDLSQKFKSEDLKEALKGVLEHGEYREFLVAADKYFDDEGSDPEKNPVRKLFGLLKDVSTEVTSHNTAITAIDEERAALSLEKEIISVRKLAAAASDDGFDKDDSEEWTKLGDIADKQGINLTTAYKLKSGDTTGEAHKQQLGTKDAEIEKLTKSLKDSKKEVKARNEEIAKLKKYGPLGKPKSSADSINTGDEFESNVEIDPNANSEDMWDKLETGVKEKMDVA